MRDKHRRAWLHTRSPDPLHAVLPALALAVGTAAATCYFLRDNKEFKVSDVVLPTLVGLGVFFLALLFIHGGEYTWRFITGKAPKGSPRTLRGMNMTTVRRLLRENIPEEPWHNMIIVSDTIEVRRFTNDLRDLLEGCGWSFGETAVWGPGDGTEDVEIELPVGGNKGLEALADFLNQAGYKAKIVPPHGSSTVWIKVGEASH